MSEAKKVKDYFKADYTKKDIFKFYKSNFNKNIDIKIFNEITNRFADKVAEKLYMGFSLKMPYELGLIKVEKFQPDIEFDENGNFDFIKSTARTDWGATRKLWKEKPELAHKKYLVFENHTTSGYIFRFAWSRNGSKFRNLKYYGFSSSRGLRVGLKRFIDKHKKFDYDDFRLHIYKPDKRKTSQDTSI